MGGNEVIAGQTSHRFRGFGRAFRHEGTQLFAERAVQYESSKLIEFTGGVRIIEEGDTLWADRISYLTDEKLARGYGNIRWSDGQVALTASDGEYLVDDKLALFIGDVVMKDSTTMIASQWGRYEVEREVATFAGGVRLDQESLVITADSVSHDRLTRETSASGSVAIYQDSDDSTERVLLSADRALSNDSTGLSRLWGNPTLIRISESNDTLVVGADRLTAMSNDSTEMFEAVGDSKIWGPDLAGIADSLRYTAEGDSGVTEIEFHGSPAIWSGEAQVSGDTVKVTLDGGSPTALEASPNAFVAFEDSASGKIQQIKGDRLSASFRSDTLRQLIARPQAEALYFGEPDEDGKESAVQFSASTITLNFVSGEVGRIVASTDVSGEIKEFETCDPSYPVGFLVAGG